MGSEKKPRLPIKRNWKATGKDGETYIVDVSVVQTADTSKYPPDGIKSVYRFFKLNDDGAKELVILIDNHEPDGFHEHPSLPEQEPRKGIHTDNWQDAWGVFEERMEELLL
jgi:hypothetical protein